METLQLSFKARGDLPPVLMQNVNWPAQLRNQKILTKGFELYWLLTETPQISEDILLRLV